MGERDSPLIAVRYPAWSRYWQTVLPGLLDFVQLGQSWSLQTEDNSHGEMESVKIDENWRGDGAILFRATEGELRSFRKRGMGVVLTSTEGPDCGFPRVIPDNGAVGRHAAEHLLEKGVQHFAFLARGETLYLEERFAPGKRIYPVERLQGFRDRLAAEGIVPLTHFLKGRPLWKPDAWRQIRAETGEFLRRLPAPCGLFVVDDALAAVAVRAAEDAGLAVPARILMVSYGDDPLYCLSHRPALSSIPHPGRRVGYEAAVLLDRQMRGEDCHGLVRRVPVAGVVQRESSDSLAIEDAEIAKLLAWVRRHAPTDPLQVRELAGRFGMSVSALNTRFREAVGHGPKHEIKRVRLERLKHLLVTTPHSLAELGDIMRFASAHELSRFFLKETGERPNAWRLERSQTPNAGGNAGEVR